jgi:hypothetical protein
VEAHVDRLPGLEKWFVDIYPPELGQAIL